MIKLNLNNNIYKVLFAIYILSLSLHVPLLNKYSFFKISDIFFLILLIPFSYYFLIEKKNIYFDKVDLIFLLFPISFIPNIFILNFSYNSLLGFFSGLYLFLIYFITKNISRKFNLGKFYTLKLITYLGFFCASITLVGVFLFLFNININVIHSTPRYPFLLFDVYFRSQSFLGSASMLSMYLIIATLSCFFCYIKFKDFKYIILITIILAGLFLLLQNQLFYYFPQYY